MKRYLTSLAAVLVVMAAAAYAGAQVQPGVGRVSLIHGDVTMQRGDSGDWVDAKLNTPMAAGDKVAWNGIVIAAHLPGAIGYTK